MVHGRTGDYVLSRRIHSKLLKWLGREQLICEVCGEEIRPGDHVHRCGKVSVWENQWAEERSGNPFCRFYHSECFGGLYIEC
jgi:hypothetical protein